ncbi:MAG: phosphatase PAP2 family protein [Desulfobacteraceae bacterium]
MAILKWAYQRNYKPSFIIKALVFMGDGPFWLIVMAVAAFIGQIFNVLSFEQVANLLIFGLTITNFVITPLKKKVKRKRPYADKQLRNELNLIISNRDLDHGSRELESFPSGHAVWTSLSVFIISFQFGYIGLLLFGWMIPAIMYLRPHLGVHYPSDVIAGFFIGGVNAMITIYFSPIILDLVTNLKVNNFYTYGYWAFILFFLFYGYKSWLKRV